ncbi:MAG: hypothetical protein M3004_09360 [Bacteroidota bacterium]|nr:hypothetical protein [Bacteroidota bacterium]
MKKISLFIFILFSFNAIAQKATLADNVAMYLGKQYKVGDIVHLGYGSGNNKQFSFINYGKSISGISLPGLYHHADENWSKADVEIEKVYKTSGVIWLKCKPIDKGSAIGSILGNKIFINIEGAVDNKEINGVSAQTGTQSAKIETPPVPVPSPAKAGNGQQKAGKQIADPPPPQKVQNKKVEKELPQSNKTVNIPANIPGGNSNGKLYFRTLMLMSSYGNSLELSWLFLGNNGTIVRDPKHGVNPINFSAELADNADNAGKYKISNNKLNVTWQNGRTENWGLEYDHGELSAVDGGLVSRPDALPANYKISGQYAASAVLPGVSSVQTFVFSKDGTFTLNRLGTVHTAEVGGKSESNSNGTYTIGGNTLHLNFANGEKQVATIWMWDQGNGKHHLVINKSSFPQEK